MIILLALSFMNQKSKIMNDKTVILLMVICSAQMPYYSSQFGSLALLGLRILFTNLMLQTDKDWVAKYLGPLEVQGVMVAEEQHKFEATSVLMFESDSMAVDAPMRVEFNDFVRLPDLDSWYAYYTYSQLVSL